MESCEHILWISMIYNEMHSAFQIDLFHGCHFRDWLIISETTSIWNPQRHIFTQLRVFLIVINIFFSILNIYLQSRRIWSQLHFVDNSGEETHCYI
jgi:FtsH-binding integral membrane protein